MLLIKSDFLLRYGASEGFAAMVIEPNRQFGSFATLVRSTSHLPRLRRSANFSSTLRTLCHEHFPFETLHDVEDKRFLIINLVTMFYRSHRDQDSY